MTLHVVLGDGYMPTKELTAHLEDMRAKALADDDGFWFLVQAKAEPTDTDRALVKWLSTPDYDIYWDAIGDKDAADKIYHAGAQTIHKATRLAPKITALMEQAKAGGVDEEGDPVEPEDADLLALFFSDEEGAAEDDWLNDVISAVADAGFAVFAFNDGMTPIEPPDAEEMEEMREGDEPAVVAYTREMLADLDLDELKKIAQEKGVTVAPRSRKPTYIDAILGEEDEVAEVEMEPPQEPAATKQHADANTSVGGSYTTGSTSGTVSIISTQVSGPAMVIVVYDGQVTSRVVTAEQAQALLSY